MGAHAAALLLFVTAIISLQTQGVTGVSNVSITLLQSGVAKGAVCLDGTAPGYAYFQGYGDGADKWIVFLMGGGWCLSSFDCYQRSQNRLGSSTEFLKYFDNHIQFDGILDDNATSNPGFYNWNKFLIFYCDGSSFLSDNKELDPVYNISYRGGRIYDAMMEELMVNKGMARATDAILAGGSAGGLATILYCDKFRALFNNNATKVKCYSDSGFFSHGLDFIGVDVRESRWFNVIKTHGLTDLLPSSCTLKFNPILCLFADNLVPNVQTPIFLVESAFDQYQLGYNVFEHVSGELTHWEICTRNLMRCNWTEILIMKEFRTSVIRTLKRTIDTSSSNAYFVDSCLRHGHIQDWAHSYFVKDNVVYNKTLGQAFSDWYFRQTMIREIDTSNDLPRNCTQLY